MKKLIPVIFTIMLLTGCQSDNKKRDAASVQNKSAQVEWVVFNSQRGDNGGVYAVNPKTGKVETLIDTPSPEGSVRYDVFRNRIIHTRYGIADETAMVMSGSEELFTDPTGDSSPVWDPAGQFIAYTTKRDGREDLYVSRPDNSEEKRISDDDITDRYPAIAPNGAGIVLARKIETGWDLFITGPTKTDSVFRRVTKDGIYVGHPAWSPDGRYLAFDRWYEDNSEIAILDLKTNELTRLTERSGNDLSPTWSSDGKHIAFSGNPDGNNWDVWTVNVEAKELKRLTSHEGFDGGAIYIPDEVVQNYIKSVSN